MTLRVARRLGRGASTLVLLLGIVAGLAWLAPSLLGYDRYVITGGSMSGTFDKGSVVFGREVPVGELEVGDVITYLPPADSGTHQLVTHRIIAIGQAEDGERLFRTQGDANPDPDPWKFELQQDTVPVDTWSVPLVGHWVIALADPDTRRLLLGIPAALIALLAAIELVRALRERLLPAPVPS